MFSLSLVISDTSWIKFHILSFKTAILDWFRRTSISF